MAKTRLESGTSYGPARGGKWAVYRPDASLYYDYGDEQLAIKTALEWGPQREGEAEHIRRLYRAARVRDDFCARLKRIRSDRSYTQKVAARKIGVSSQVWSDIETGRKAPGPSFYCAVHETFGVDLNWLIAGEGKE